MGRSCYKELCFFLKKKTFNFSLLTVIHDLTSLIHSCSLCNAMTVSPGILGSNQYKSECHLHKYGILGCDSGLFYQVDKYSK